MIVRQFLHWVRTAPAGERAEATSALARAYLFSDLSTDDRSAAEGAMIMLLDDPSPLVREALAHVLASSQKAPPAIIQALAADQPDIAVIVIERSPLFIDADLVDLVATGAPVVQVAVARRAPLQRAIAAAIAEVGTAEACLVLLENPDVEIALFSINRMVERFGHVAAIREALFDRDDLPAPTRQMLVTKLSATLADFVAAREWLDNVVLVEQALAELSGLPIARVRGLVHDNGGSGFRAIYDKAGLPGSTWPAFRAAITATRDASHFTESGGASQLKRRMIERVLTGCEMADIGEIEPLLTLLRRFATEAARDEARRYCDELVADARVAA